MELSNQHRVFIGFKLETSLRRQLDSVTGPDKRYVSTEDSTFLRLCRRGDDTYVGKVIEGELTTNRVEDVRRNVLSIMRRLCPDTRLPEILEIWVAVNESREPEKSPPERAF